MTVINATPDTTTALATVDTTVPVLSIGQIAISADRRSTKERPLADHERIRRVVLPAGHWGDYKAQLAGTANQSLTDLLRAALTALAADRLKDALATDPLTRTVPLADYSIPALLAWSAETATSRGALTFTRDDVETWFAASATRTALVQRLVGKTPTVAAATLELVAKRFATLAAKNHGLATVAEADKMVSLIDPADLDGSSASLVTEIIGRLEHIRKALAAKAAEATVSLDDL